ncbi:MAG: hypothetical protein IJN16_00645 [Lachnospiraceae bacterium]|nr:hypothetical protein [Lachnospiraceae bacterium]
MDKYFYTENTDKTKAVYCADDGIIKVVYPETEKVLLELKLFGENYKYLWYEWNVVPSFAFVPNREILVITYGVGYVFLVDLVKRRVIKHLRLFEEVSYEDDTYKELDFCCYYNENTRVDFSPSGKYMAIRVRGDYDPQDADGRQELFTPLYFRTVFVMDMNTFEIIFTYSYPHKEERYYDQNVAVIAFSPEEDVFVTGALLGLLKVFHLPDGEESGTFEKVEWIADSLEIQHRQLVAFLSKDVFVYVSEDKEIIRVCRSREGDWIEAGKLRQELLQDFLDEYGMILDIEYNEMSQKLTLKRGRNALEVELLWE